MDELFPEAKVLFLNYFGTFSTIIFLNSMWFSLFTRRRSTQKHETKSTHLPAFQHFQHSRVLGFWSRNSKSPPETNFHSISFMWVVEPVKEEEVVCK